MSEELEIDDLLLNHKNKKIKSGVKGKRGEREIVNILNSRFKILLNENPTWGGFSRSVASGARWGQNVNLPKHAQDTFSGDITSPTNFKFVLESKIGYNSIDLYNCINGDCSELDKFLTQVTNDSIRSSKLPLLLWKKDRKERIVFVKNIDDFSVINNYLIYKDWFCVNFKEFLKLSDKYFFNINI
jgi:hypothetical protein